MSVCDFFVNIIILLDIQHINTLRNTGCIRSICCHTQSSDQNWLPWWYQQIRSLWWGPSRGQEYVSQSSTLTENSSLLVTQIPVLSGLFRPDYALVIINHNQDLRYLFVESWLSYQLAITQTMNSFQHEQTQKPAEQKKHPRKKKKPCRRFFCNGRPCQNRGKTGISWRAVD